MKNFLYYSIFLLTFLTISRLIPHPPNFTPIIASSIVFPYFLKDKLIGLAIPIIAMFISDLFIGFHPYQFVIYSTLITISLISTTSKNYFLFFSLSIIGSVWFFITTNFAVWLIWDFYEKNIDGLILCYTLAIPFFKNTLMSSVFFVILFIFAEKYINKINIKLSQYIKVK